MDLKMFLFKLGSELQNFIKKFLVVLKIQKKKEMETEFLEVEWTPPPWYILHYNFLVTHPNFMKFDGFSYNLSRINVMKFYFQNSNWFLLCQHFYATSCYFFVYVFCLNNEYILDNISRI